MKYQTFQNTAFIIGTGLVSITNLNSYETWKDYSNKTFEYNFTKQPTYQEKIIIPSKLDSKTIELINKLSNEGEILGEDIQQILDEDFMSLL